MTLTFRFAEPEDIPAILALLSDDDLGSGREVADMAVYARAFDEIRAQDGNDLIVGVDAEGAVQATYQLTIMAGFSLAGARRAQVENVRVARQLRGKGYGRLMFQDAEIRARAAGAALIQLDMNKTRTDSHRFYEAIGFTPSHIGFKRYLD